MRQPMQLMRVMTEVSSIIRAVRGALILATVICMSSTAAWAADFDSDGVSDGADNCVSVANAGQLDSDFDGAGNACDFDYNNDGQVNDTDADLLRSAYGSAAGDPEHSDALDADDDGVIGGTDWAAFVAGRKAQ